MYNLFAFENTNCLKVERMSDLTTGLKVDYCLHSRCIHKTKEELGKDNKDVLPPNRPKENPEPDLNDNWNQIGYLSSFSCPAEFELTISTSSIAKTVSAIKRLFEIYDSTSNENQNLKNARIIYSKENSLDKTDSFIYSLELEECYIVDIKWILTDGQNHRICVSLACSDVNLSFNCEASNFDLKESSVYKNKNMDSIVLKKIKPFGKMKYSVLRSIEDSEVYKFMPLFLNSEYSIVSYQDEKIYYPDGNNEEKKDLKYPELFDDWYKIEKIFKDNYYSNYPLRADYNNNQIMYLSFNIFPSSKNTGKYILSDINAFNLFTLLVLRSYKDKSIIPQSNSSTEFNLEVEEESYVLRKEEEKTTANEDILEFINNLNNFKDQLDQEFELLYHPEIQNKLETNLLSSFEVEDKVFKINSEDMRDFFYSSMGSIFLKEEKDDKDLNDRSGVDKFRPYMLAVPLGKGQYFFGRIKDFESSCCEYNSFGIPTRIECRLAIIGYSKLN